MKQVHGMWFPDGDQHFEGQLREAPTVFGGKTYQYKKYQKVMQFVPRRHFAVDVGGHVGLWSRVMGYDFRKVWAFEPLSAHRECFLVNTKAVANNIQLFPYAIGNAAGNLHIDMPVDNTGHSQVSLAGKGEYTQVVTLDSLLFPDTIDFLKIDVEGFELPVVQGAEATIRRHKPTIIIEQKPNGNAETFGFRQHDAVNLLKSWGAKEVTVMAGDHILVW